MVWGKTDMEKKTNRTTLLKEDILLYSNKYLYTDWTNLQLINKL